MTAETTQPAAAGETAVPPGPHNPILINPDTCIRCMICDYVCPGDIIHKAPRSKELPVIAFPDECWYCGLCEQACPAEAITVVFPDNMLNPETQMTELLGRDPE